MMWTRIKSFFAFYVRAITRYNVQAPFLYDFVTHVLDTEKEFYSFEAIENQRKRLRSLNNEIIPSDFGGGSVTNTSGKKKVSDIAQTSLSGISKCRILFNIVNHYTCHNILELGTSLGISSAYLASANHNARIITMEGDKNIATIAAEMHQLLGIKNVDIVTGQFKDTLSGVLEKLGTVDLVFIDGHHKEEPTIQYFNMIHKYCGNNSIIVIDDIYWSEEMTSAWHKIMAHSDVTLSVDLFDIGIVFFRKELSKQHVAYLPYKYKPWKIGLFG